MSYARLFSAVLLVACFATSARAVAATETVKKTSIAVMNLRGGEGVGADIVDALATTITQTLEELGPFEAISRKEIEDMLEHEATKQAFGCDDAGCLAEIGGALGVEYLVAGSILEVSGTYVLQLQLTNIGRAKVDARVSREYSGGPSGLFEDARVATKLLVRDILKLKSGRLLAKVSEEGASIKIDGTIVGVSPQPSFDVAGGLHTLTVEKEGFVLFSQDVEIEAKKEHTVEVSLLPSEEFKKAYTESAGRTRLIAWGTIGAGAASVLAGGIMLGMAYSRAGELADDMRAYNEQPLRSEDELRALNQRESDLGTLDAGGVIATGVGIGLVATGVLLYLTGDDPNRYEATTSVSTAAVSVAPNGMSLTVRF